MTEITFANIIRIFILALSAYNIVMALLSLWIFGRRIDFERDYAIKPVPRRLIKHVTAMIIWGILIACLICYDIYDSFNTGLRWQTFFFTVSSMLFAYAIYQIYDLQSSKLQERKKQVADAQAEVDLHRTDA